MLVSSGASGPTPPTTKSVTVRQSTCAATRSAPSRLVTFVGRLRYDLAAGDVAGSWADQGLRDLRTTRTRNQHALNATTAVRTSALSASAPLRRVTPFEFILWAWSECRCRQALRRWPGVGQLRSTRVEPG